MPKRKRQARSSNASGYIGVFLRGKKYYAQIRVGGKIKYPGTYDTAKQAAKAYDAAAIEVGKPLSGSGEAWVMDEIVLVTRN